MFLAMVSLKINVGTDNSATAATVAEVVKRQLLTTTATRHSSSNVTAAN